MAFRRHSFGATVVHDFGRFCSIWALSARFACPIWAVGARNEPPNAKVLSKSVKDGSNTFYSFYNLSCGLADQGFGADALGSLGARVFDPSFTTFSELSILFSGAAVWVADASGCFSTSIKPFFGQDPSFVVFHSTLECWVRLALFDTCFVIFLKTARFGFLRESVLSVKQTARNGHRGASSSCVFFSGCPKRALLALGNSSRAVFQHTALRLTTMELICVMMTKTGLIFVKFTEIDVRAN